MSVAQWLSAAALSAAIGAGAGITTVKVSAPASADQAVPAAQTAQAAPDEAVCKALEDRIAAIDNPHAGDQRLWTAPVAEQLHSRLGCDPMPLARRLASYREPPKAVLGGFGQ